MERVQCPLHTTNRHTPLASPVTPWRHKTIGANTLLNTIRLEIQTLIVFFRLLCLYLYEKTFVEATQTSTPPITVNRTFKKGSYRSLFLGAHATLADACSKPSDAAVSTKQQV